MADGLPLLANKTRTFTIMPGIRNQQFSWVPYALALWHCVCTDVHWNGAAQ